MSEQRFFTHQCPLSPHNTGCETLNYTGGEDLPGSRKKYKNKTEEGLSEKIPPKN